jgi:hypothetical protein
MIRHPYHGTGMIFFWMATACSSSESNDNAGVGGNGFAAPPPNKKTLIRTNYSPQPLRHFPRLAHHFVALRVTQSQLL